MKRMRGKISLLTVLTITALTAGCSKHETAQEIQEVQEIKNPVNRESSNHTAETSVTTPGNEAGTAITPGTEILELEAGLSTVKYNGDYWFDDFLSRGGALNDTGVIEFLNSQMQLGAASPVFQPIGFGCSTMAVSSPEGENLFGRNFDWENCEALIVQSNPSDAYSSISTVNMDFILSGFGADLGELPDEIRALIALYAPLDGMNESGLAVSVNMIQDSDIINQDTGKPGVTTTTAIRLLLDKAANVEEALGLLEQYDMHSSMGTMVHFALADKTGRSVVVEYINNEMVVTDTPAVTNFYLAEGEKQGIGTSQSHARYEILMELLSEQNEMSMEQVRDALDSVSKDNFGEFESTEWSIVFNLNRGEARYYHRENYGNSYLFHLGQ